MLHFSPSREDSNDASPVRPRRSGGAVCHVAPSGWLPWGKRNGGIRPKAAVKLKTSSLLESGAAHRWFPGGNENHPGTSPFRLPHRDIEELRQRNASHHLRHRGSQVCDRIAINGRTPTVAASRTRVELSHPVKVPCHQPQRHSRAQQSSCALQPRAVSVRLQSARSRRASCLEPNRQLVTQQQLPGPAT